MVLCISGHGIISSMQSMERRGASYGNLKQDLLRAPSPAIGFDGTVYVGSSNKKLFAVNGKTGDKLWEFETGHLVGSSPAIGLDGTCMLDLGTTSSMPSKHLPAPTLDSPWPMFGQNARRTALAENRQNLTETPIKPALNIDTPNVGTKIWEFQTGDEVNSSPAVASDGTVYVGSWDNKLYAINGKTGVPWEFETGDRVGSSPPSARMARCTSGHGTTSSMPSMAKRGTSYGNLKQEVLCTPHPPSDRMARCTSGHGTTSSMPSMAKPGSSYGNLKREKVNLVYSPHLQSVRMAQCTLGQGTKSSMPSMARLGTSYGNLKQEVMCVPLPPSDRMARCTSGHGTKSSMPSMAKRGSSYGNLKREGRCGTPPPSDRMARCTSGHRTTSSMPSMAKLGGKIWEL